jgi:hypothetical protein
MPRKNSKRRSSKTQPHHRRSTSLDGSKLPFNVSNVNYRLHQHWHTLAGNMNAFQICDHFNNCDFTPKNLVLICRFINGSTVEKSGGYNSQNKEKIDRAWKALSAGLTYVETIWYFNNFWLDPSYHFDVVERK